MTDCVPSVGSMPDAHCYLRAYEWAQGHTGSGAVIANLLLNLYNSSAYPLVKTYGLHGTLDAKRRLMALECIQRYTYFGENDPELLQVGRMLEDEWPGFHARNLGKNREDWVIPGYSAG